MPWVGLGAGRHGMMTADMTGPLVLTITRSAIAPPAATDFVTKAIGHRVAIDTREGEMSPLVDLPVETGKIGGIAPIVGTAAIAVAASKEGSDSTQISALNVLNVVTKRLCHGFGIPWRFKQVSPDVCGTQRQDEHPNGIKHEIVHLVASLDNNSYFNSILSHGNQILKASILCDTGARPNLIALQLYRKFGKKRPKLEAVDINLESASGNGLHAFGKVVLGTRTGDHSFPIYFVVRNLMTNVIFTQMHSWWTECCNWLPCWYFDC